MFKTSNTSLFKTFPPRFTKKVVEKVLNKWTYLRFLRKPILWNNPRSGATGFNPALVLTEVKSILDLVLLTVFHDAGVDAAGRGVVGVLGEVLVGLWPVGRAEDDARGGLADAEVVARLHEALVGRPGREGLEDEGGPRRGELAVGPLRLGAHLAHVHHVVGHAVGQLQGRVPVQEADVGADLS